MVNTTTHMYREIRDIPDATRMLLTDGREQIRAAAAKLRDADPNLIITVARGSSDHAATHFKYACELTIGVPVASIGPSIVSIYGAKLKLENSACIGISQSGQSPDIVEMVRSARQHCVGCQNEAASPLARACSHRWPLRRDRKKRGRDENICQLGGRRTGLGGADWTNSSTRLRIRHVLAFRSLARARIS